MSKPTNLEVNHVVKASIEATEAALLRLQKRSVKKQTFEYGKQPVPVDVPLFPDDDSNATSASSSATTGGKSLISSTGTTTGTSAAASTGTATSAAQTDASSKKKQRKKNKRRHRCRGSVQVVNMSDSANSSENKSAAEDTAVEMESKGSRSVSVASSGAKPAITIVPGTTKITPLREVTGFVVDLNVRTEGRDDMPLRVEFPGFVPKRIFDGNWRSVV